MRFFSFVPALAWIAVGLLRRRLWDRDSARVSAGPQRPGSPRSSSPLRSTSAAPSASGRASFPLLRERGIEPAVLTLLGVAAFYDELAALGESVACADLRGRLDIRGIREVVNAERVIDVVVTQGFAGQVVGHLIARHAGVPHVTTEHLPPTLERRRHERHCAEACWHGRST